MGGGLHEKFIWGSLLLGEKHKSTSILLIPGSLGNHRKGQKKHFSCCSNAEDGGPFSSNQILYYFCKPSVSAVKVSEILLLKK